MPISNIDLPNGLKPREGVVPIHQSGPTVKQQRFDFAQVFAEMNSPFQESTLTGGSENTGHDSVEIDATRRYDVSLETAVHPETEDATATPGELKRRAPEIQQKISPFFSLSDPPDKDEYGLKQAFSTAGGGPCDETDHKNAASTKDPGEQSSDIGATAPLSFVSLGLHEHRVFHYANPGEIQQTTHSSSVRGQTLAGPIAETPTPSRTEHLRQRGEIDRASTTTQLHSLNVDQNTSLIGSVHRVAENQVPTPIAELPPADSENDNPAFGRNIQTAAIQNFARNSKEMSHHEITSDRSNHDETVSGRRELDPVLRPPSEHVHSQASNNLANGVGASQKTLFSEPIAMSFKHVADESTASLIQDDRDQMQLRTQWGLREVWNSQQTHWAVSSSRPASLQPGKLESMTLQVSQTRDHVEVSMKPDELGKLTLKLDVGPASTSVLIITDRIETQDLAKRHLDLLQSQLEESGFSNLSFHFSDEHNDEHKSDDRVPGDDSPQRERASDPQNTLAISAPDGLDIKV